MVKLTTEWLNSQPTKLQHLVIEGSIHVPRHTTHMFDIGEEVMIKSIQIKGLKITRVELEIGGQLILSREYEANPVASCRFNELYIAPYLHQHHQAMLHIYHSSPSLHLIREVVTSLKWYDDDLLEQKCMRHDGQECIIRYQHGFCGVAHVPSSSKWIDDEEFNENTIHVTSTQYNNHPSVLIE